ncbi:MAG: hypothetical protein COB02_16800 [Candidatus Cloacimonadota bacterium]|nr:MAG: hypothetical protein COB02_16800 [Candidatus Cloacimonadota bacterium]
MQTQVDFDIAILCGGLSSRFKDDKTLAKIDEKTIIQCTIDSIKSLNKNTFLVCKKKHQNKYKSLCLQFAFDKEVDSASIFGLKTALEFSTQKYVLVLSADLPCFNKTIVSSLLKNPQNQSVISFYNGLQPLASLYNTNILLQLENYISNQSLAIQKFIKSINHTIVDFSDLKINYFQNINTKQDLIQLLSNNYNIL